MTEQIGFFDGLSPRARAHAEEYERWHRDDRLYEGQAGAFALYIDAWIYGETLEKLERSQGSPAAL